MFAPLTRSAHLDHVETVDTGGHELIDLIVLKGGCCLSVSADCIVVFPLGKQDFWKFADGDLTVEHTVIY